MFYTSRAIEHRGGSADSLLRPLVGDLRLVASTDRRAQYTAELAVDQILADSFPASDPPSWTLGVAQPAYWGSAEPADETAMENSGGEAAKGKGEVNDVSFPRAKRPFLQGLVSLAGAAGIALLVPFAILLIGLPIVLVVRGVAEAIAWLLGLIVG